jgi:excisionase family DNA binding protein
MRPREVAEMLNVSVSTIYRMAQEDVLPSSGRVNGRLRFERDAILQWWEDQKQATR